jgi:hypothetical protein
MTTPGVSSPLGIGTQLDITGTFTDYDGTTQPVDLQFFVRLDGNVIEQYSGDFQAGNRVVNLDIESTDPSFDLLLNESRVITRQSFGFTFETTYTYLGQEVITTPLGTFTTCKIQEASDTNNETVWYAVGVGLPIKRISEPLLPGVAETEVTEFLEITLNGVPIQ